MHPDKVARNALHKLTDLPNVGPATEADLILLGINTPEDLIGRDPYQLHRELCMKTGIEQDPCMIDVFISLTRFMQGDEPRPWWHYTDERKATLTRRA